MRSKNNFELKVRDVGCFELQNFTQLEDVFKTLKKKFKGGK